jgi:hypothetical protein
VRVKPQCVCVCLAFLTAGGRRAGPDYFTASIIKYRVFDDSFAQFELQVQTGKRNWTVLRRFSEFDKLRFRSVSPRANGRALR